MALRGLLHLSICIGISLAAPTVLESSQTMTSNAALDANLPRGLQSVNFESFREAFVYPRQTTGLLLAPIISAIPAIPQSSSSSTAVVPLVPIPKPPTESTSSKPVPPLILPIPIPPSPAKPPLPAFPSLPKPSIPTLPTFPKPPQPPSPPAAVPPKPTPHPPGGKPSDTQHPSSEPTSEASCTSTRTPIITISISHPTNSKGEFDTTTQTISPSGADTRCQASATTTTTTATFKEPVVYVYAGPPPGSPWPTTYAPVDEEVQQYLGKLFESLGIREPSSATTASSVAHATASCDGKTYAEAIPSAAAFVQGLLPNFCSEWSAKPGDTMSKIYTAKDVKNKSRRQSSLNRRTPPPAPLTQSSYPGWNIDFEWRSDHATGDCLKEEYCTNSLTNLLSQCKGYSLADAYSGGQTQDECGTFRYTIKGYPAIKSDDTTCNLPTVNDPGSKNTPHQYQQKAFEAAATMFCHYRKSEVIANPQGFPVSAYYWENTASIDPRTNLPAVCYQDGDSSYSYSLGNSWGLCKAHPPLMSGRYDSDSNIGLSIIPSPSQEGCSALGEYKIPTGDDCYNNFMQVIGSCMSGDGGGKVGVWREKGIDGCWDWWIWGRELYK